MQEHRILTFYGSYREARMGIRLARWVTARMAERGCDAELIDAKAVGLPMLERDEMKARLFVWMRGRKNRVAMTDDEINQRFEARRKPGAQLIGRW